MFANFQFVLVPATVHNAPAIFNSLVIIETTAKRTAPAILQEPTVVVDVPVARQQHSYCRCMATRRCTGESALASLIDGCLRVTLAASSDFICSGRFLLL